MCEYLAAHTVVEEREHILKEQDGVFPAALAALGPEQWERIESVRAQLVAAPTTPA
jgi:hypothetical protein